MRKTHSVFSYGTLCDPAVQRELFGRLLCEEPDALIGWTQGRVAIDDAGVVGVSVAAVHPILRRSGDPTDRIAGSVLALSDTELAIADDYETSAYIRIAVRLASGGTAFVYVDAADPGSVAAGDRLG